MPNGHCPIMMETLHGEHESGSLESAVIYYTSITSRVASRFLHTHLSVYSETFKAPLSIASNPLSLSSSRRGMKRVSSSTVDPCKPTASRREDSLFDRRFPACMEGKHHKFHILHQSPRTSDDTDKSMVVGITQGGWMMEIPPYLSTAQGTLMVQAMP